MACYCPVDYMIIHVRCVLIRVSVARGLLLPRWLTCHAHICVLVRVSVARGLLLHWWLIYVVELGYEAV